MNLYQRVLSRYGCVRKFINSNHLYLLICNVISINQSCKRVEAFKYLWPTVYVDYSTFKKLQLPIISKEFCLSPFQVLLEPFSEREEDGPYSERQAKFGNGVELPPGLTLRSSNRYNQTYSLESPHLRHILKSPRTSHEFLKTT